jgi:large subunit ribosomal protein L18
MKNSDNKKLKRQIRVRAKVKNAGERLRLSVYRSNKYISAQIIDDVKNVTVIGVSEQNLKTKGTKSEKAKELGKLLAEKAKAKKITKIVFDRGSYAYHGRVKQVAEGAREGGLEF